MRALIEGANAREETADWAGQWVYAEQPGVDDRAVWHTLLDLVKVDVQTSPETYLYSIADVKTWLDELDQSASS